MIEVLDLAGIYQDNLISTHGVEILLFEKHSRYVKRHHIGQWVDTEVIEDIRQLVDE